MRILALSDKEDLGLWNYYAPEKVEGVDLIIACGDLKKDYLEFLVTMINKPLLYVNGNHDRFNDNYYPEGCENIDGKLFLLNDLRVLGLGGSNKYSDEAGASWWLWLSACSGWHLRTNDIKKLVLCAQ